MAQAQQPAICEDYPDLPVCDEGDDGNNPDDEDDNDEDQGPTTGGGGDADGSLPFTGYPITDLLLLLAALLATGLAIRAYLAIRQRAGGEARPS